MIIVKAKGVITENVLQLKILKTGNNSSIKWGRCPYVIAHCLEKIVDIPRTVCYCQSGHFALSGIKFLIRNFTGVPIINFIPDWESKNYISLDWRQKLLRQNENESSLKKQFHWRIFFKQVKIQ